MWSRNLIIAELSKIDIHSDIDVAILAILFSNKYKLTQKEIAVILNINASRISILVYALARKGYVIVERNAADRRQHHISLAEKATLHIPFIQQTIESVNVIVNHQLDNNSLSAFYDVLRQMETNLSGKGIPIK